MSTIIFKLIVVVFNLEVMPPMWGLLEFKWSHLPLSQHTLPSGGLSSLRSHFVVFAVVCCVTMTDTIPLFIYF